MPIDLSGVSDQQDPLIKDGVVKILLTYSNTSLFQTCKWKYWVRQIKCLSPKYKEEVFSIGHAYHAGIEEYYKVATTKLDDSALIHAHEIVDGLLLKDNVLDNVVPTKVKAMVRGYARKFATSPYEITNQEMPFLEKLPDAPDFYMDDVKYEFWVSGKIDAEMIHRPTGGLFLGEWKTCTTFDDYMSKIRQDNQPWQYILGYYLKNKKQPNGVVYRLAKKTMIRQKKSETIDEFMLRVAEEYENNLGEYFHEEMVPFDTKRADKHFNHLYDIAKEIRFSVENDLWTRSHGSCFNYNKPCGYMNICKADSPQDFEMMASSYFDVKAANEELAVEPTA